VVARAPDQAATGRHLDPGERAEVGRRLDQRQLVLPLSLGFAQTIAPHLLDPLFPNVEVADTTPGRRLVRRLGALPLTPLATALIKAQSKRVTALATRIRETNLVEDPPFRSRSETTASRRGPSPPASSCKRSERRVAGRSKVSPNA